MYLIGNGIDIHRLEKQNNKTIQKLGGVEFNLDYKVIAYSDGDIILHSISDAILGALALGDIGNYFKDTDVKNKEIDSKIILKKCLSLMHNNKYKISNIDITVISEHIIFVNHKEIIVNKLKEFLDCNHVSFKATRWEENKLFIQCNSSILLKKY